MALRAIFKNLKQEDNSVIRRLDNYLLVACEESDRAINVNSPSQASNCLRANYYMRTGESNDGSIDPRTQRIFDNGTCVHERLQDYLKKANILVQEEVPVIDETYNIQGHTDGLIKLNKYDLGILEIKSINSNGFNSLKEAKYEHKQQAMVYLYCTEKRRQKLRAMSKEEFIASEPQRRAFYEGRYSHIKEGKSRTRQEKIDFQVNLNLEMDKLLFRTATPITKIVFLYECKDNQELKEFMVEVDEDLVNDILARYEHLNYCVENEVIPDREGTSKSCITCRWCRFKILCWN